MSQGSVAAAIVSETVVVEVSDEPVAEEAVAEVAAIVETEVVVGIEPRVAEVAGAEFVSEAIILTEAELAGEVVLGELAGHVEDAAVERVIRDGVIDLFDLIGDEEGVLFI